MEIKPRLQARLQFTRKASEDWLSVFKRPEEWTNQVAPGTNHALWFAGHMAFVDNSLLKMLSSTERQEMPEYATKFGMKSQPSGNPADYPPPEEVLATMRDRRAALMRALDKLSEEELAKPCPPGGPAFFTDVASALEFAIWHEGMHAGQITQVRRAMGIPPLFA